MKMTLTVLALFVTGSAFASPNCTDSAAIKKAALKQARIANGTHEVAVNGIEYTRTTKDGKKDMYTVNMSVNEECLAEVYVYTDANTCDVKSAAGGNLTEGACG